ncbi:hypothetical protein PLESTB_001255000 [Pleodorina starrii]|uniref:Methyltransferase domain-containing protein n=1 Tax=Pleodorina starrii TaxID=330485 RepID=A0A9W6BT63_9CHLO|nr:hypothetical protein PLESTM_000205000 [Pleodorina starrii]GLC57698.1 hypothetical protein PLESTB_001255000 [Pleodorina starrii]GLC63367.1 hypothetical protein PLESTF_000028800 [Pleodorina starrii]
MSSKGPDRDRIWNFQKPEYWNDRYKQRLYEQADVFNERKFDWLCTYEAVRDHIDPYLAGATLALDIGCGNADFAAAVCEAHPSLHVTGIDYSCSLFDLCGSSLGPAKQTQWLVMDARALAFRDLSFDVILDKGCLDALLAGFDQVALLRSWGREVTSKEEHLSQGVFNSVMQLLREVERCLVPGGRYVCISYEGLTGRERFFTAAVEAGLSLTLVRTAVEADSHNFIYIFVKGPAPAALPAPAPAAQSGQGVWADGGAVAAGSTGALVAGQEEPAVPGSSAPGQ